MATDTVVGMCSKILGESANTSIVKQSLTVAAKTLVDETIPLTNDTKDVLRGTETRNQMRLKPNNSNHKTWSQVASTPSKPSCAVVEGIVGAAAKFRVLIEAEMRDTVPADVYAKHRVNIMRAMDKIQSQAADILTKHVYSSGVFVDMQSQTQHDVWHNHYGYVSKHHAKCVNVFGTVIAKKYEKLVAKYALKKSQITEEVRQFNALHKEYNELEHVFKLTRNTQIANSKANREKQKRDNHNFRVIRNGMINRFQQSNRNITEVRNQVRSERARRQPRQPNPIQPPAQPARRLQPVDQPAPIQEVVRRATIRRQCFVTVIPRDTIEAFANRLRENLKYGLHSVGTYRAVEHNDRRSADGTNMTDQIFVTVNNQILDASLNRVSNGPPVIQSIVNIRASNRGTGFAPIFDYSRITPNGNNGDCVYAAFVLANGLNPNIYTKEKFIADSSSNSNSWFSYNDLLKCHDAINRGCCIILQNGPTAQGGIRIIRMTHAVHVDLFDKLPIYATGLALRTMGVTLGEDPTAFDNHCILLNATIRNDWLHRIIPTSLTTESLTLEQAMTTATSRFALNSRPIERSREDRAAVSLVQNQRFLQIPELINDNSPQGRQNAQSTASVSSNVPQRIQAPLPAREIVTQTAARGNANAAPSNTLTNNTPQVNNVTPTIPISHAVIGVPIHVEQSVIDAVARSPIANVANANQSTERNRFEVPQTASNTELINPLLIDASMEDVCESFNLYVERCALDQVLATTRQRIRRNNRLIKEQSWFQRKICSWFGCGDEVEMQMRADRLNLITIELQSMHRNERERRNLIMRDAESALNNLYVQATTSLTRLVQSNINVQNDAATERFMALRDIFNGPIINGHFCPPTPMDNTHTERLRIESAELQEVIETMQEQYDTMNRTLSVLFVTLTDEQIQEINVSVRPILDNTLDTISRLNAELASMMTQLMEIDVIRSGAMYMTNPDLFGVNNQGSLGIPTVLPVHNDTIYGNTIQNAGSFCVNCTRDNTHYVINYSTISQQGVVNSRVFRVPLTWKKAAINGFLCLYVPPNYVHNQRVFREFPQHFRDIAFKDNCHVKIPIREWNAFTTINALNNNDVDIINVRVGRFLDSIPWLKGLIDTNPTSSTSLMTEIADGIAYHIQHREGVGNNGNPSIVDKQREAVDYYKNIVHQGNTQAIVSNIVWSSASLLTLINTSGGWWDTCSDLYCWYKSHFVTRAHASTLGRVLGCEMNVYTGDSFQVKTVGLLTWLMLNRVIAPAMALTIMRFGRTKGALIAALSGKIGLIYFALKLLYACTDTYINRAHYISLTKGFKRRVTTLYKYDVLHPYHACALSIDGTPIGT